MDKPQQKIVVLVHPDAADSIEIEIKKSELIKPQQLYFMATDTHEMWKKNPHSIREIVNVDQAILRLNGVLKLREKQDAKD